jgi:hypothetical protein
MASERLSTLVLFQNEPIWPFHIVSDLFTYDYRPPPY